MTQIAPMAPKIKCLIPKIRPPSLSLNETSDSKENIEIKANENINYFEPKLQNKVYSILDFYKEKNELIFFPKVCKLYGLKTSDKSLDTKSSENDLSLE